MLKHQLLLRLIFTHFLCFTWTSNITAQVITDGSTGVRTVLEGPNYEISAELGHQAGANLFHSFEQFNLTEQEQAIFSGSDNIDNIINRITGDESSINGVIRSDINDADFYFINPAGIIFGTQAHIDIKGSFYATTADYLKFTDGAHFNATHPEQSQFTIASPDAFGFLDNNIAEILKEPSAYVDKSFLSVPEGKTIAFVGGDLTFTEALPNAAAKPNSIPMLQAPDGAVYLISTATDGEIPRVLPETNTRVIEQGGVVRMTDTPINSSVDLHSNTGLQIAHIDVSGTHGGRVVVQGEHIFLQGIFVYADTQYTGQGQGFNLQATKSISLTAGTRLATQAKSDSDEDSKSGTLWINAPKVILSDGATLDTTTQGSGAAGDIVIKADNLLHILGWYWDRDNVRWLSGLLTLSGVLLHTGKAGKIDIETKELCVEGGEIIARTLGYGAGGEINIKANQLFLSEQAKINAQKNFSGPEKAGDINLTVDKLEMTASAITTDTRGAAGGNITINASDYLYLKAGSKITSSAEDSAGGQIGDGGMMVLNPKFIVLDGGEILAQADAGTGGRINITTTGIYNLADMLGDNLDAYINADAQNGINGIINIKTPSTDIELNQTTLSTDFYDATLFSCDGFETENISHFIVAPHQTRPPSIGVAFD